MHVIKGKHALLPIALLVTGGMVQADDLVINGFMSVAGGGSDNSTVSVAGYDQDVKFTPDSVLGIQLSKSLAENVSLTGQLVSRGTSQFDTSVEWAFATINVSDDMDLRAGRMRAPFFYYSDFLDVGYAYNWIRPPSEVYRIPFTAVDGVDLTYRYSFGNWDSSAQVYYGQWNGPLTINEANLNFETNNLAGVVYNLSNDWINLRASYHRADITSTGSGLGAEVQVVVDPTPNPALGGALGGAGGGAVSTVTQTVIDDEISEFYEVAAVFDLENYQFIAEWTALQHQGVALNDDQGWLVSVARRFDDKAVHLTYAENEEDKEAGQLLAPAKQSSVILGMRYDFAASTAFKAEIQYNDEETINGADGEDGMLYTVAIDMVF